LAFIPKFAQSVVENIRPHIAYLTASDPGDKRSWSGIHFSVVNALGKYCGNVTALGPYHPSGLIKQVRAYSFALRKLTGKRFDYSHSEKLARHYGKWFSEKLKAGKYDLVFATAASTELAFLETDLPVYYTADATFASMTGYYDFYSQLSARSLKEGNLTQQLALNKARQLFFPSQWAARSAASDYGIAQNKIHLVPFGANLEELPAAISEVKNTGECRLLFLGVEWERKGGPVALDTMKRLRSKGIDAKLTIVGCTPQISEDHVTIIPFLSKNDPVQRKKLYSILAESDFLILPTKAECFGLVFCEASAYGIPSLSADTGGVNGAIKNGINGFLFPPGSTGSPYAEKIAELSGKPEVLMKLRRSARELYDTSLNWDAWGKTVSEIILADYSRLRS
jgi:glycosyltransferase involved in cell wall biosynthesis